MRAELIWNGENIGALESATMIPRIGEKFVVDVEDVERHLRVDDVEYVTDLDGETDINIYLKDE